MNINDLPPEIAALARKRQQEYSGNSRDYYKNADKLTDAFDWDETTEGDGFWDKVNDGDYEPFYARYGRPSYVHPNDGLVEEPVKEWVPKVGERVLVWTRSEPKERLVFLFKFNNLFYCVSGEEFMLNGLAIQAVPFENCEEITSPRRITRAEIAKAMNIEGDNFEIVD